ncbi:Aim18p NDAI_0D03340 [Naumovozyma dairenensis CBS 421]|uniref:Altered inheritance of mitochondria protein 18, mitochondrial n=1 Tax=Naumovozyma dairenensis (strain ATCC 10597 / BCRC 20456 / CBS 421 / NBRC 0211 / NRRL Y-12639) TaxID=1071378 RepID=G0WA37_NAUDC|nr:hypothetical protein NDAI_0D03340 [Naumovozyma dairenensis CBS 421]CCD24648.1 hypothetical protein NDAI_0D03340 [Naumovozyma dairenensis CBS 421]
MTIMTFTKLISKTSLRQVTKISNAKAIGQVTKSSRLTSLMLSNKPFQRKFSSTTGRSQQQQQQTEPPAIKNSNVIRNSAIVTLTLAAAFLAYKFEDLNFSISETEQYVDVDPQISPFPKKITPSKYPFDLKYSLLGVGVRSVTVVTFKVYALGIYVADKDKYMIPKLFNSNYLSKAFIDTFDSTKSHAENLRLALMDPVKSTILINELLDNGINLMAKISPMRNTNFNHLRDGMIRTIKKHPEAEKNKEALDKGILDLRKAFNRKGALDKDDDLYVQLLNDGALQLTFHSKKRDEFFKLGRCEDPIIGRYLFSQYVSGPAPLSIMTRDAVVKGICDLV